MAKKKLAQREEEKPLESHNLSAAAMDEASEKLESLKSLNNKLLKEMVEKRQLVDSLEKAKESLESEKFSLRDEVARLGDAAALLDLERSVAASFLFAQMGHEMEMVEEERDGFDEKVKGLEREIGVVVKERSEIEKAIRSKERELDSLKQRVSELSAEIDSERKVSNRVHWERDELVSKLGVQIEETDGLRVKLIEIEKRERKFQDEAEKLRSRYNGLLKENEEKENRFQSLMDDKELIARNLVESNSMIDELNGKIGEIVREKEGIEEERNVEMKQRSELEKEVKLLDEKVLSLLKVEERLRESAAVLEKNCAEGIEKGKEMEREISKLVVGKNENEARIAKLVSEKDMIELKLGEALEKIELEKQCVERMAIEKTEMEKAIKRGESEIGKLQKQVFELKDTIYGLEESCKVQKERITTLESEVSHYKCALESAALEREEAQKSLDGEKQNVSMMKEKISEIENRIKEVESELAMTKADYDNMVGEKKELEKKCRLFDKDILSLETGLADAKKEISALQAKLDLANAHSEEVLNLLKSTAASVGSTELAEREMHGEGVKPHVLELEAIKKAIQTRENKVEDMKREVEFLQNSVTQANKRKSLWTIISSATTLFAAISLAYVARGH